MGRQKAGTNVENTLAVAVSQTKEQNQLLVRKMIAQIDAELAELKKHTNNDISIEISYDGVLISSHKTVGALLETSAAIMSWFRQLQEERNRYTENTGVLAGAELGELLVEGYNKETWFAVLSKAISLIRNKAEIESREATKAEFSEYLSEEDQLKAKFEKLGATYRILK